MSYLDSLSSGIQQPAVSQQKRVSRRKEKETVKLIKINRKLLALSFLMLTAIIFTFQPVQALSISCPQVVNASHPVLKCTVSGSPGERVEVRLKSFDSVQVHALLQATKRVGNETYYSNLGKSFVDVPFNVSVDLSGPMEQFLNYLDFSSDKAWILYNKINTLTFELSYPNGAKEEKRVNVCISGKVPSPLRDKETRNFLLHLATPYLLLIALAIGYQLYKFIRWNPLESDEEKEKDEKEELPHLKGLRKSFAISGLIGLGVGLFLLPWILHLLASPPRIVNDVRLYLPTTVMAGLTAEWLAFVKMIEKGGKPYLYLLRNPPVTGIEWIAISLLFLGKWGVVMGILGYPLLFLANSNKKLNRHVVKVAPFLSLAVALALTLRFPADSAFILAILVLSFLHPYLIKKKAENAPSLEEIHPMFKSRDAHEIVDTFERILNERKLEKD